MAGVPLGSAAPPDRRAAAVDHRRPQVRERVTRIAAGVAWSLDGGHLFYTRYDQAWRPYQVWRHEVGSAADEAGVATTRVGLPPAGRPLQPVRV